jgi:cytochrome c biogenesis protein CcmG, thiol:disulfide interchange protein DsbE
MTKQWFLVGAIVVVLAAVALLVLKLSPAIFPVEVDSRAPDFHATALATGQAKSLADYKGRVVLLNVWATWCQPCRLEMPSMERLQRELGPEGLRIVAVSIDEGGADVVKEFVREYGLSFEVLHDPTRSIERIYQTTGVPESFVLNKYGIIVKKVIGAAAWDAPVNRDLIRRLLAQTD